MIVWRLFYFVLFVSVALLIYAIYSLAMIRGSLDQAPASFTFGPADAGLHVVAFVDYDCAPCRAADAAMMQAMEKDGGVRYSPLPISSETPAEFAMKLTYSAGLQGKYKEAYRYFMTNDYKVEEKDIADVGLALGIDEATLRAGLEEPLTAKLIDKSYRTFSILGGKSVPTFLIGHSIRYEPETAPSVDDFLKLFAEARGP
ncbi:MAG: thioredoxin domain-containing protein [Alphaproteobacteria bacterium]